MQSGHTELTSPNRFYGYTESIGVCVAAARRVSLCSLLLRPINAELTVLSAGLTPPPRLTLNKYNTSQDSIDFRVVLSLSCLRAFRLVRIVSPRAFFGASGFVRCMLSLLTQQLRLLLVLLPLFVRYRFSGVKSPLLERFLTVIFLSVRYDFASKLPRSKRHSACFRAYLMRRTNAEVSPAIAITL